MSTRPTVQPEVRFLGKLLDWIEDGRLRIPKFQRPFVWGEEQIRKLFDSLYRGYPIGSIFIWETGEEQETLERIGPFPLPQDRHHRPRGYVLDGHQRLACLYGCLRAIEVTPRDDAELLVWRLYFNLDTLEFEHRRPRQGPLAPCLFPVRAIEKTQDFLQACRRIAESFSSTQSTDYIQRAEELANRIKQSQLAVLTTEGGDLEQAVEMFARLNEEGRRISKDQMLSALSYRGPAFRLEDSIDSILAQLRDFHFQELPRNTVFDVIQCAVTGAGLPKSTRALAADLPRLEQACVGVAREIRLAVDFLRNLGVVSARLLPYSNQVLFLCEFFRQCPEPTEAQADILEGWFWTTSFCGWFAGRNATDLNRGLLSMRNLASAGQEPVDWRFLGLFEAPLPLPDNFDFRSARIKAHLLAIYAQWLGQAAGIIGEFGAQAFRVIFPDYRSIPANRVLLPYVPGQSVRQLLEQLQPEFSQEIFIDLTCLDRPDVFLSDRTGKLAAAEQRFWTQVGIPRMRESDL